MTVSVMITTKGRLVDLGVTLRALQQLNPVAMETLITFDFAPHGDRQTLLSFRQEPFVTRDGRDDHVKGWSQVLDSFAATLAGERS